MPAIKCPKCGHFNKDDKLQCQKCGSPIPQLAPKQAPKPKQELRPGELGPGQLLANRFSVIQLIGRGGMGSIYKVHDNILGETVAVKTLLAQFASDKALVERFLNEARIARRLSHPNIVRMHDIGTAGETIYISMELLSGRSLREVLESMSPGQRLPISEVLRIFDELCQALEYAHQYTIHRDIKPENVMVTGDGTVKLMDFGISKLMANTRLTQASMVMGTPFYMSPEQLRNSRDVDARADIFSVGVMLYEVLTGNLPSGVPKPASQMMEDIPPALDAIVAKCVEPDPENRFQSASDLRKAILPVRNLLETGAKRTFMQAGPRITGFGGGSESAVGKKVFGIILTVLLVGLTVVGLYFVEQMRVEELKQAQEVPPPEASPTAPQHLEEYSFADWSMMREQILAHIPPDLRSSPRFALHFEQGEKRWLQAQSQPDSAVGHRMAREAIQYYTATLIWPEGMKFIPPGTVVVDGETIQLEAFFVDETEVTYKDFVRFCNDSNWRPEFASEYREEYAAYPISNVAYYDAQAYTVWAKKSLPTRAQWCMAAYGSEKPMPYPWGNDWVSDGANTLGSNSYVSSLPVKSMPKDTTWSYCFDMSGNVAEWTRTPADKQMQKQGVEPDFGLAMMVCGGHYENEQVTFQDYSAVAYQTRSPYIGIRCVKKIPSTPQAIYALLSKLN